MPYTHRTRAGSFLVKNKYLQRLLEEKGENTDSTWTLLLPKKGSVQHLPFLTEGERAIYKTADELDQSGLLNMRVKDKNLYVKDSQ